MNHHEVSIESPQGFLSERQYEPLADSTTMPAGFSASGFYLTFKRAFDVFLAVILFVCTAPLMAVIAIAIRLESFGPVVFKQERVGQHGTTFIVYKFRSMHHDAERDSGPVWAKEQDGRITAVGRFLRKSRLDELPQLVNVLLGQMSFVGPRPERPYFVDMLRGIIPCYSLRHDVKPGITGYAQVMYPYGASIADARNKLHYDLYYANYISPRLDALILLKTIKVVVSCEGR